MSSPFGKSHILYSRLSLVHAHSLHLYTLTGLLNFFISLVHQEKKPGFAVSTYTVLIAKIIQWMFEHGICSWSWA
jgi:hypothetical protein